MALDQVSGDPPAVRYTDGINDSPEAVTCNDSIADEPGRADGLLLYFIYTFETCPD
jgi:hypothetical protein